MTSLQFSPLFDSTVAALMVAVVTGFVLVRVTPPIEDLRRRRLLIGLRVGAAAVLALALFQPAIVRTSYENEASTLWVAADASQSMTLPDREKRTRWQTQVAALDRLHQQLERRRDPALDVQWFNYDSGVQTVAPDEWGEPRGRRTSLAKPIARPIAGGGGDIPAGLVLMGDGTDTSGGINEDSPGDGEDQSGSASVLSLVGSMDALGVPLYTVPIGPEQTSARRDVSIEALPESYQLFAGNRVEIRFTVRARGAAGVRVPVTMKFVPTGVQGEAASAGVDPVAVRQVTPSSGDESISMSVPVTVPSPGTYQLVVVAKDSPGEILVTNNRQIAFVEVREGGGRVLYLEGSLRNEQIYLRRSLRRFPDLQMTFRVIRGDDNDLADLNLDDFDAFILGDLAADRVPDSIWQSIVDRVSDGGGLITLGGANAYAAGRWNESPLGRTLPIDLNGIAARPNDSSDATSDASPVALYPSEPHPITDIGGTEDGGNGFADLPPMLGANRIGKPSVRPGVKTLLESPGGDPMMVIGPHGRGRVIAMAFDSTWRWWRNGYSEVHRRFWRQTLLWSLSREVDRGLVRIEMDRRRMLPGGKIDFAVHYESTEAIDQGVNLRVEVVPPTRSGAASADTFNPTLRKTSRTSVSGTLTPMTLNMGYADAESGNNPTPIESGTRNEPSVAGVYKLRATAVGDGVDPNATAEMTFEVVDRNVELEDPNPDPSRMRQLASLTSRHGGDTFAADQMDDLVDAIMRRRDQSVAPVVDRYRFGDDPASAWLGYVVFAAALSADWILRRRWGLA